MRNPAVCRRWVVLALLCWTLSLSMAQVLQRKVCPFVDKYKPARKCTSPTHLCNEDADCDAGQRCCPQEVECALLCRPAVPPRGCPIPIDLAFVLDSSGSIGRKNWVKVKAFVNGIINYYDISEKGTHVALIMYSNSASVKFHFNKFKGSDINNVNIKREVDDLRLERGLTFIDKGLKVAHDELFVEANGMRPEKKKVCLVITDGIQTKDKGPYIPLDIASAPLKKKDITVYALGIGTNVDLDELTQIGSGPDFVYSARSFDELQAEVEGISKAQCQACGTRVDVVFGIPDATTLGSQLNDIKKFFVKLTSLFQVNARTSHIGIVRYSNSADMVVKLDQMYNIKDISDTITSLQPQGREMNVAKALQIAADGAFTIFGGVRQTAPKTFIVFVPKDIIQKPEIAKAATKLKGMGVRLIMLGITGEIDKSLTAMASQPPVRYFISAVDFDALGVAAYEAADTACKARYGKSQAILPAPAECPSDAKDECDVDKDCSDGGHVCTVGKCGRFCQERVKNCFVTMDVVIAIDTSSDVTDDEFTQTKSLADHIIHFLADSENSIRLGLMEYNEKATKLTNFRPITEETKLKAMVNEIKKSTNSNKKLTAALTTLKDELFSLEGGVRQGHPRFAIVITSGKSSEPDDFTKAFDELVKLGVKIIPVGVNKDVSKSYLDSLATSGTASFRPLLNTELVQLWPKVLMEMCSAKPGSCPVPAQQVCSGKPKAGKDDIPCGVTAGYPDRAEKINDWDCPGEQRCCLDPSGCQHLCQHPPNKCTGQYDLALILESTDSVGREGFEKIKTFAIQLVDAFTIWQAASRVAVITYGSSHKLNFMFNSFIGSSLNKQAVTMAIKDLELIGGNDGSTSDAMQVALDDVFTTSGGSRENANKSLVIISQGKFRDGARAINIASNLRKNFVDVFAVPIGDSSDLPTLVKVVNKPTEKNIFITTSFNALIPNVRALTRTICQGAQKIKVCKLSLDVVFGIPSSRNLGPSFKGAEDVFKSILSLLRVSNLQVHVGVETYSDTADLRVEIDTSYNKENITDYIDGLKAVGKTVDVEQALKVASNAGFSIFGGVRQTSPKAFILFVPEGASLSDTSIREAAKNLKGLGVRFFVIGLKSAIDKALIKALVSQPSQKFIYTAESYAELAALASEIVDSLCRGRYGRCPISSPITTCPDKPTSQCLLDKDCTDQDHQCCEDQCGSSACTKGIKNCFVTMDVAIAIDSSSDISDADFNQIKSFAAHLIHSLAHAENAIRFSLMQYGQQAKTLVNFLRITTETTLKSIVEKMQKFPENSRRVDIALSTMSKEVFSLAGGMRQGHPRYAVFITSGATSANSEDLTKASGDLRKLGVNIVAIGVTDGVDRGFLNALSTEQKFSFPLRTSTELQTLWPRLARQMCNAKPGKCPVVRRRSCRVKPQIAPEEVPCGETVGKTGRTARENDWDCPGQQKCCLAASGCHFLCQHPPNECHGQYDLTIIMEASKSIGNYGLDKVKEMAIQLVDAFTISWPLTRVAIISHADSDAIVNLRFNTFTGRALTKTAVKRSIADINVVGESGASLSQALQIALDDVCTVAGGSRDSANKSLVFIGHGLFKNSIQAIAIANRLKQKAIDIFAVPIGPNADVDTITKVVSRPIINNVFMTTSFNALRPNVRALTKTICRGAQKVITCDQPLDIVFGIPNAHSLGITFRSIKDVFISILGLLKVNKMQVHVGVQPYSDIANFPVHIDTTYNRDAIANFISRLQTNGYGINLADSFNVASNRAFTIYGGVRQTSPKVLILLVPGLPPNIDDSLTAAVRKLKGMGVKVFVIGLSGVVDRPGVRGLASQPTKKYLYAAGSYPELGLQAYKIVDTLCKGRYGRCKTSGIAAQTGEGCPVNGPSVCDVDKQCPNADHMCCQDGCGTGKCEQRIKNCFVPSEIVFALDTSESTTTKTLTDMKNIITGITRSLANSENNLHIGLMSFASTATPITQGFRNIKSEQQLQKLLELMPKTTDTSTRVDIALRTAKREFFSPKGGQRHGHSKYLIVLLSANPASNSDPGLEKSKLRESGVNVIAVGMTGDVQETFLKDVATGFWMMLDQSSNEGVVLDISSKLCHEKPGKCPAVTGSGACDSRIVPANLIPCGRSNNRANQSTSENDWDCPGETKCCLNPTDGCHHVCLPPPLVCKKNKDILFMVESTSRIGPAGFSRVKTLMKQIVNAFDISESTTKISLMTVNRRPRVELRFNTLRRNSLTKKNVLERIDRLRYSEASSTSIHKGLEIAANRVFNQRGGATEGGNKTVVLFTSGQFIDSQAAIEASQRLKELLVDVYAVPIGSNPDVENLENTVSSKTDDNIFMMSSSNALKPQLRALVHTICEGAIKNRQVIGPPGPPGLAGLRGSIGPPGRRGYMGEPGVPGEKGRKGSTGPPGNPGNRGPQGPPGPMRVKTIPGPKGPVVVPQITYGGAGEIQRPGEVGPSGRPGPRGFDGKRGRPGSRGAPGETGEIGRPGLIGPPGPTGRPGEDGDPGSPGRSGPQGDPGRKGPPGDRGNSGQNGLNGHAGRNGRRGRKGDRGVDGERGLVGAVGLNGNDGLDGERGLRGVPGLIGDAGLDGLAGPRGASGRAGSQGRPGLNGPAGPPGPRGPKGSPGRSGNNGPTGYLGETGINGLPGIKGIAGKPGESGKQGSSGPKGANGDIGSAGEQGAVGETGARGMAGGSGGRGERGQVGDAGKVGNDGEVGTKGAPGKPGENGPAGQTGPVGKRGLPGDIGAQGMPGSAGKRGMVGSQGIQGGQGEKGLAGAVGEDGVRGESGSKGDAGDVGDVGAAGPNGERGARGRPGNAGQDGERGLPGENGDDGRAGEKGPPGTRGPNGAPGLAGPKGKTGAIGKIGRAGQAGPAGLKGYQGVIGGRGLPGGAGDAGGAGEVGGSGPIGEAGGQGKTGKPGARGLAGKPGGEGPKGNMGASGNNGKNGKDGAVGERGEVGGVGDTGKAGEPGNAGRQGVRGVAGAAGSIGTDGPAGPTGSPGLTGQAGKSGAKGSMGDQGVVGARGEDGEVGGKGPDGGDGERGPMGTKGSAGETGDDGGAGAPGNIGDAGQRGDQGAVGKTGIQGLAGSTGPVGQQGLVGGQGKKGVSGERGEVGLIGLNGLQGSRGAQGAKGGSGVQGTQGESGGPGGLGLPGPPGPSGPGGSAGPPGTSGRPGQKGPPGDSGTNGEKGEQGASGKDGKDGEGGDSGDIGPAGAIGAPGKPGESGPGGARGGVGLPGNAGAGGIVGIQGESGASGNDGKPGKPGPAGAVGREGRIGSPGIAGADGSPGGTGGLGAQGKTGRKGIVGDQGKQGLQGIQGPQGRSGALGASGSTGLEGLQGKTGAPGAKGTTGEAGKQGSRGEDGSGGDKGSEGAKGDRGVPGRRGPVGAIGPKGMFGSSGQAGSVGLQGDRGSVGDPGAFGPAGKVGPPGPAGGDGLKGAKGDRGNAGPDGQEGSPGTPGPPGPPGTISGTWTSEALQSYETGAHKTPRHRLYRTRRMAKEKMESVGSSTEIFSDIMSLSYEIQSFKRPTGSKNFPAKTCKDLNMCHPNLPSGHYWIDPNEGIPEDAMEVYCDFENKATCIYPLNNTKVFDSARRKWYSGPDEYKWFGKELQGLSSMKYTFEPSQLTFLRILSDRAIQNITYHCRNSVAWYDKETNDTSHSIKIMSDNGIEFHANSSNKFKPIIIIDDCQIKDGKWRQTIISVDTTKPYRLPISDVAMYDIGGREEEFGVEIGPVCFS